MARLMGAVRDGGEPAISGRDNLRTMALVEACYRSAAEGRAVAPGPEAPGPEPAAPEEGGT